MNKLNTILMITGMGMGLLSCISFLWAWALIWATVYSYWGITSLSGFLNNISYMQVIIAFMFPAWFILFNQVCEIKKDLGRKE